MNGKEKPPNAICRRKIRSPPSTKFYFASAKVSLPRAWRWKPPEEAH
jgi:hypothetical protein